MLHKIAFILVIVGGVNWLLFALFNWDIGTLFGGPDVIISKVIYVLVGLSAIYLVITHKKDCAHCLSKKSGATM